MKLILFLSLILICYANHKPIYHITPEKNWMNDPNAPIYYRNNYHFFYQHNPNETFWGKISWGHVYSSDLIHWKRLPIAISPTDHSYDSYGIWSGMGVIEEGEFIAFYTGVTQINETFPFKEVQCIASSKDPLLLKFKKYETNPILSNKPIGNELSFRDPFIFKENKKWKMLLSSGYNDTGGNVIIYESDILKSNNWKYKGKLIDDEYTIKYKNITGTIWECPILISFENHHQSVLFLSADKTEPHQSQWYSLGILKNKKFIPERMRLMDSGYLYAVNSFKHSNGNDLLIGWIKESRSRDDQIKDGWSGSLSLPSNFKISNDGYLEFEPIKEIESLRKSLVSSFRNSKLLEKTLILEKGNFIEIYSTFLLKDQISNKFGFYIKSSNDFKENTKIYFDKAKYQIIIEREDSSLSSSVEKYNHIVDVPRLVGINQPLEIRIFIDASVIEVFVNKKVRIATRVYPLLSNSISVYSYSDRESINVNSLFIWEMNSIWNDTIDEEQSILVLIISNLISSVFLFSFILLIYLISKIKK
eukprot:gene4817-8403_t